MFTGSLFLFNILSQNFTTAEKGLKIDVPSVHESYHNRKIAYVMFISSAHNLADPLTKFKRHVRLQKVLRTNKIIQQVKQWFIRERISDDSVVRRRNYRNLN